MADCMKVTQAALLKGMQDRGPVFAPDADGRWIQLEGAELPSLGGIRPKRPMRDLFVNPIREIARWKKHVSQPEMVSADPETTAGTIFGARPCDARALTWLDKIFLAEPHVDLHYRARRENLLTVGLACEPVDSCHCGLFGYGPDEASELDVMLHPADDGFLAVAGSERGADFIKGLGGSKADAPTKREGPRPDWWTDFPDPKAMMDNFEHPVWDTLQVGCMNCGACTLYCPTCQCFTIVDEPYKDEVLRLRVIDTCQHEAFTRMAGGHNPRTKRSSRLRQRVMHKFAYCPEREGELGCSGCGRCVELCGLKRHLFADLVEIRRQISEEASCGT